MTTSDHYREAEHALGRAKKPGSPGDQQDLTTAQLHALLVIADELRDVRNELTEIRRTLARSA
jgi:hypothetical protein